jgi:hypothetical protein
VITAAQAGLEAACTHSYAILPSRISERPPVNLAPGGAEHGGGRPDRGSERARRTAAERFSDAIARIAGSAWFAGLHVLWFAGWIAWNAGLVSGWRPIDPFPFTSSDARPLVRPCGGKLQEWIVSLAGSPNIRMPAC